MMIDAKAGRMKFGGRDAVVLGGLFVLVVMVCVARLLIGNEICWPNDEILRLRSFRLVSGLTVGAALSVAGVLLQALLRNPLASPYILGVSSGAALGWVAGKIGWVVVLGWVIGDAAWSGMLAGYLAILSPLAGALATLVVIYVLAQKRGQLDPLGLLLVGVIVNAINGAIIMFIHYRDPHGLGVDLNRWMMGYINEGISWGVLWCMAGVVLCGILIAVVMGRSVDVATFSDAEAHALGLHLPRLRLGMFGLAGLLTAASVQLAGPIGFVGLVCPHIVRLMIGPRHTLLLIGGALAGGALVVGADTLIKLLDMGKGLMPLGVLMVVIGGPVFLWMLRGQLGRGSE